MPAFEVDVHIEGYPDSGPRHHYVVVADDVDKAKRKAAKKFRGWIATKSTAAWARPLEIVR